jgi:hypothetical protein
VTTLKKSVFDDLEALRLSPDAIASVGTKEVMTTVPVRKPGRNEFVRVNPDPAMMLVTMVFDDKEERQTFFVAPAMWGAMVDDLRPVTLVAAITRQGAQFLWPCFLPPEGGSGSTAGWFESAAAAVELAKKKWIRVKADMAHGAYRIFEAQGDLPEPIWPDKTMAELLDLAFRDRVIDSEDHLVVKRLRGFT